MPKRHAILPVKDVNQQEFVRRLSHYIKKAKIIEKVMDKDGTKLPEWVEYAKTGIHKELPPNHQDWLYVRMAVVMRRVYMRSPCGVGGLRRKLGGSCKRRGVRPNHFRRAAGGNIRFVLQCAHKMGWMKHCERGRAFTRKGKQFMDEFSGRVKRTPMVQMYWQRRKKLAKLKKKLERKKYIAELREKGLLRKQQKGGGDAAITAGGGNENAAGIAQDYVGVQTDQGNIETVEEFE